MSGFWCASVCKHYQLLHVFFVLVLERLISFLWFGSVIVHGEWIYFLWSGSVLTYGGGSFLTCEDLGRMFDHSFPTCAFFLSFFFEVEISLCTLISLFMPGLVHSGSLSWDYGGRMFPDKLCVSSFPDRFPHCAWTVAWSAHSDFIGSMVYVCLGVTSSLHLWQNDQDSLCATAVTWGWSRHWIRVST